MIQKVLGVGYGVFHFRNHHYYFGLPLKLVAFAANDKGKPFVSCGCKEDRSNTLHHKFVCKVFLF
jgi:hypothetical protein